MHKFAFSYTFLLLMYFHFGCYDSFFEIDLNTVLKVALLGKETLIPPRMHYSRYISEYVLYVVINGSPELNINGKRDVLKRGDVYLFKAGDRQEPLKSSFCEYYYVHFHSDRINTPAIDTADYPALLRRKQELCFRTNAFTKECYDFLTVVVPEKSHISNPEQFYEITQNLQNNILTAECKLPERRMAISNAVASVLLKTESANIKSGGYNEQKIGKAYDTVRNVAAYIQEHCTEPISGADIEKRFFLTFDYVNRIFKKFEGLTPSEYKQKFKEHVLNQS